MDLLFYICSEKMQNGFRRNTASLTPTIFSGNL